MLPLLLLLARVALAAGVGTPCLDGRYELAAPTATTDTVCARTTTCWPFALETHAATPTSDRQCSGAVYPWTVSANLTVAQLRTYTALLQSLYLNTWAGRACVLPVLMSVGGDVTLSADPQLTLIDIPQLTSTGGNLLITGNIVLTFISMSSLTHVGQSLQLDTNSLLRSVELPSLVTVGGDLYLASCSPITSFALPFLQSVGLALKIKGDAALQSISMPLLTFVGVGAPSFVVANNPQLSVMTFTSLLLVDGEVEACNNSAALVLPYQVGAAGVGQRCRLANGTALCPDYSPCPPPIHTVYGGDLNITGLTASYATKFAGVRGDVTAAGVNSDASLVFPVMSFVGGSLVVNSNTIGSLSLPHLQLVSRLFTLSSNHVLTFLDVSSLTFVGADINFISNALIMIILPALTSIGGSISFETHGDLKLISLPLLTHVPAIFESNENEALTFLHAPALQFVGGYLAFYSGHSSLQGVNFDSLAHVEGAMAITNILGSLSTITFPMLTLVGGVFEVFQTGIAALNLPSLAVLGTRVVLSFALQLSYNRVSMFVSAPAIEHVYGTVQICNNEVDQYPYNAFVFAAANEMCQLQTAVGSCSSPLNCMTANRFHFDDDVYYSMPVAFIVQLASVSGSLIFTTVPGPISASYLTYIGGEFSIEAYDTSSTVLFSVLTYVGGTFSIELSDSASDGLHWASFPALLYVQSSLYISNPSWDSSHSGALTMLDVPALTYVGFNAVVAYQHALTAVSLPQLSCVGGDVMLINDDSLQTVRLSALQFVSAQLIVDACMSLTALITPSLTFLGSSLIITNNDALLTLSFPLLARIRPPTVASFSISITNNSALHSFDTPQLVAIDGDVLICQNGPQYSPPVFFLEAAGHFCWLASTHSPCPSQPVLCAPNEFKGNVTNPDTDFIQYYSAIGGYLYYTAYFNLTLVDLPSLNFVMYDLIFRTDLNLVGISLPALIRVQGAVSIDTASTFFGDIISYIYMPELAIIGTSFLVGTQAIPYKSALTQVLMPMLTYIGADCMLYFDGPLTLLDLSSLASVRGSLWFEPGSLITRYTFLSLAFIGDVIRIQNNVVLEQIHFPALTSVASLATFPVGALSISYNLALELIHAPLLAHSNGSISVCGNAPGLITPENILTSSSADCMSQVAPACGITTGMACPVAPCIWTSSVLASTWLDVSTRFACIHGPLLISNSTFSNISSNILIYVTGDVTYVNNHAVTHYMFPSLTYIGGSLDVDTPALTSMVGVNCTLAMPQLSTVIGNVSLHAGYARVGSAPALVLPSITHIGSSLFITSAHQFTWLDLPMLMQVRADFALTTTAVKSCTLPSLSYLGGSLVFDSNNVLTSIVLPALWLIDTLGIAIDIQSNPMLTYLSMPALSVASGDVLICSNGVFAAPFANILTAAAGYSCAYSYTGSNVCVGDRCPVQYVTYNGTVDATIAYSVIQSFAAVHGSVMLEGTMYKSIALPMLTVVSADMQLINNANLTLVLLPALLLVGGSLVIDTGFSITPLDSALSYVSAPRLSFVGTSLFVQSTCCLNNHLTLINMPALAFVGGDFGIMHNSALQVLSLPSLAYIQGSPKSIYTVSIDSNAVLSFLSLPALVYVGAARHVCGNAPSLVVPDTIAQSMPNISVCVLQVHGACPGVGAFCT